MTNEERNELARSFLSEDYWKAFRAAKRLPSWLILFLKITAGAKGEYDTSDTVDDGVNSDYPDEEYRCIDGVVEDDEADNNTEDTEHHPSESATTTAI